MSLTSSKSSGPPGRSGPPGPPGPPGAGSSCKKGSWVEFIIDCDKRELHINVGKGLNKYGIAHGIVDNGKLPHEKGVSNEIFRGIGKAYKIPKVVKAVIPTMSSRGGNRVEIQLIDSSKLL